MSAAKAICDHMRDIWTGTPEVNAFIVFMYFFQIVSMYLMFYALKCHYCWKNMNIL